MERPLTFDQLPQAISLIMQKLTAIEEHLNAQGDMHTSYQSKDIYTVKEAAAFLDLSVSTVYAMLSKGILAHSKKAKRVYIFHADLISYLNAGRLPAITKSTSFSQHFSLKREKR